MIGLTDEQMDRVASRLEGTPDPLYRAIADVLDDEDADEDSLSQANCGYLDEQVFRCAECEWWHRTSELSVQDTSDNYCLECKPDA